MSKNKNGLVVEMGTKNINSITAGEAEIYVIAFNLAAQAFADIPDAEARIKRARQKITIDQEAMTLSVRRKLDNAEAYIVQSIKHINSKTKKYH